MDKAFKIISVDKNPEGEQELNRSKAHPAPIKVMNIRKQLLEIEKPYEMT